MRYKSCSGVPIVLDLESEIFNLCIFVESPTFYSANFDYSAQRKDCCVEVSFEMVISGGHALVEKIVFRIDTAGGRMVTLFFLHAFW